MPNVSTEIDVPLEYLFMQEDGSCHQSFQITTAPSELHLEAEVEDVCNRHQQMPWIGDSEEEPVQLVSEVSHSEILDAYKLEKPI